MRLRQIEREFIDLLDIHQYAHSHGAHNLMINNGSRMERKANCMMDADSGGKKAENTTQITMATPDVHTPPYSMR